MEGLPLVMTQSPKTKAQATSTVLEGMMRFVSWSRRHSEKVFHSPCLYRPPQEGESLDVHWLVMWRREKAISVTLHSILHANKPAILSRVPDHWGGRQQQQQKGQCGGIHKGDTLIERTCQSLEKEEEIISGKKQRQTVDIVCLHFTYKKNNPSNKSGSNPLYCRRCLSSSTFVCLKDLFERVLRLK